MISIPILGSACNVKLRMLILRHRNSTIYPIQVLFNLREFKILLIANINFF